MTSLNARILIVDDEPMLRRTMSDRMKFWDCTTEEASTGEEALEMLGKKSYDLVLLDIRMPGISGLEVLSTMRERKDMTDVVVLTAHASVEAAVEAIQNGAVDFLLKPADFELVKNTVSRVLESRRLARAHDALREQYSLNEPFVIGESPKMKTLVEGAKRAAQSKATILLRGESGSGKGVIAEYVHRESTRSKGPFVYVNCVALSDELIESTLFGHERGAFTGAVARKTGRFEAANSGTAFLDEIGDISPRLQAKLLHFLETGEFERVGGTRTLCVDCRIVAATNRDLETAVREGKFREDLLPHSGTGARTSRPSPNFSSRVSLRSSNDRISKSPRRPTPSCPPIAGPEKCHGTDGRDGPWQCADPGSASPGSHARRRSHGSTDIRR